MFKKAVLVAGTLALSLIGTQVAQAGQLHQGWNYSIDAVGDAAGGSAYDIKGLAIKETAEDIYVSVSANFPLAGINNNDAAGGNVGWGDLFLDFGSSTFNDASANNSLFAVKFATGTDSGVSQTGVYGGVSAKSVGPQNVGYDTLKNYYKKHDKENAFGTDFSTKESMYSYYAGNTTGENTLIKNAIDTGDRLGSIDFVDAQAATAAGLDFAHFNATGTEQITFKFDRALLPTNAAYVAHLLEECANDGIALSGDFQDVPEPGAIAGLALFGLLSTRLRRRAA